KRKIILSKETRPPPADTPPRPASGPTKLNEATSPSLSNETQTSTLLTESADLSGQLRDAKQGVDKGTSRKEVSKEEQEREDLSPGA
ncbi:hypothetical protein K435DRAFT_775634, partial [Dendrothele bispora CBS 962.96]